MSDTSNTKKYFYVLLAFIILTFWQVAFFQNGLIYDFIDVVFPFRYHFSECLKSGYFPFWDSYQQLGVPFYADLQAPTYYPELLLVSLLGGYNIFVLHFLFIAYVFIAGIGMYKLAFYFNKNNQASLFAAIAFSTSGFIIGHGQHLFLLVGAAWLPYIIKFYYKLNEQKITKDAVIAGIFTFLMLSGAYQALSFVLLYFLFFILLYFVAKTFLDKDYKNLLKIIKLNLLFSLVVILLSLPLIISTIEILNEVNRFSSGIAETKTFAGNSIKSIVSLFFPFATVGNAEIFRADVSLRNYYFGVIPLIFFIAAWLGKRKIYEFIFFTIAFIFFAASFENSPIRQFMYSSVPLMNLFISSSYVLIFATFVFILIASNFFSKLNAENEDNVQKIKIVSLTTLSLILIYLIYILTKISYKHFFNLFLNLNFYDLLIKLTLYERILVQCIYIIPILIIFIKSLTVRKPINLNKIVILTAIELIISSQLNIPFTVIDTKNKPIEMQKNISLYTHGFPVPINDKVIFNNQNQASFSPFWRNTYIFSKQVSFESFSSFKLKNYEQLENSKNLRKATLNNHLFYFSDQITNISTLNDSLVNPQIDNKLLFFAEKDFKELSKYNFKTDSGDSVNIILFTPNQIIAKTKTRNNELLTLLQTNYKGWKAYIDGKLTTIYTSNYCCRTINLPAGEHTIKYVYKNPKIIITYIFSNILFVILIMIILTPKFKKKSFANKIYLGIAIISTSIFIISTFTKIPNTQNYKHTFDIFAKNRNTKKSFFVINKKEIIKIDSTKLYTNILDYYANDKKPKNFTLRIRADIKTNVYTDALIVLQVRKNGKNVDWYGFHLNRQIQQINIWNHLEFFKQINKLENNEKLQIYIWNIKKQNFQLKNIQIDLYKN